MHVGELSGDMAHTERNCAARAESADVMGLWFLVGGRFLQSRGVRPRRVSESYRVACRPGRKECVRLSRDDPGAASGRVCKELFGSRPANEGTVDTLLVAAFRYTEMYALESGFVCNSSRLSRRRPRLSLFAEDYPRTSVGPVRLLYRAVSRKFVLNHLAAEPYGQLQGEVARRDLSGALFSDDGYVYHYVARTQALRQLLVPAWSPPALSRRNRTVLTEVAASASNVRLKRLVVGSRPPTLHGELSGEPRRYNSLSDNVAGHLIFGVVVNFDSGSAQHLCVCSAGCVRGVDESRVLFPSDANLRRRRDGQFFALQRGVSGNVPRA